MQRSIHLHPVNIFIRLQGLTFIPICKETTKNISHTNLHTIYLQPLIALY